jgi:hypothetical protein
MYDIVFAALSPQQQAQAAQIFQDEIFGSDPSAYDYAVETATGPLTGQRCRVAMRQAKKLHGKRSPIYISGVGQLVLDDKRAQVFAQLILPGLLNSQELTISPMPEYIKADTAEAGPLGVSDLAVAAPSLRPSGWEPAGSFYE